MNLFFSFLVVRARQKFWRSGKGKFLDNGSRYIQNDRLYFLNLTDFWCVTSLTFFVDADYQFCGRETGYEPTRLLCNPNNVCGIS